ncbi:LysR family transcriptional regulator [Mesorhizobium tamadayense]|uniref:LysR family transcriptional regulator n=1 Tax=Mesorhizobium tamadayense TaxID=425306 RepID=A0A3P3F5R9_9HYPH|nr:LysR family transcriptional regulator [Mesorhizobium tamadayense]RRH93979.1 LysR family transcriptional regulator [Mesorhizobium tamadayense]
MPLITQAARVLEMVARYGSIRRAAERVNSAPSAVNRQILNLETELGTALFERLPRGMRLTEAGKIIVEQVRAWQLENQRILASVGNLNGRSGGHIKIGLMECLAAEFLPHAFGSLQLRHPGASLHATVGGTAEVARQLMASEVDLAVTFNAPRDAGLKIMHETRFEMGAVMRPDHPLVGRQEVRIDDLFDYPFIIADNSLTIGPVVDEMLERSRKPPIRTVTTNSVTMLKTLVAQGTGISILTTADVFSEVRSGSLCFRPLAGGRMFELLSVAARDVKALNPATRDFAHIISSTLESLSQPEP